MKNLSCLTIAFFLLSGCSKHVCQGKEKSPIYFEDSILVSNVGDGGAAILIDGLIYSIGTTVDINIDFSDLGRQSKSGKEYFNSEVYIIANGKFIEGGGVCFLQINKIDKIEVRHDLPSLKRLHKKMRWPMTKLPQNLNY